MALGVASIVATLVREPVRDALMRRQVDAVASQWLGLLAEGQFVEAVKFIDRQALASLGPKSSSPDGDAPPPPPDEFQAAVFEHLGRDKVVQRLAQLQRPLQVEPASPSDERTPVFDSARTLSSSQYLVRPADGGEACRVWLSFVRAAFYESEGRPWRVERWQLIDEPAGEGPATVAAQFP